MLLVVVHIIMSKCFVPDAEQLLPIRFIYVIGLSLYRYIFFSFTTIGSMWSFLGQYENPGIMGTIGIQQGD